MKDAVPKAVRELGIKMAGSTFIYSDAEKIIERACLEAQLEVIREIHKRKNLNHSAGDTLGTAYYNSVSSIDEEIEAKLKAMK